MSIDTEVNFYIDWLEKSINEGHIKYYDYQAFNNIQQIGSGSFRNVSRATWKNTDTVFALKSFNIDKIALKEAINELKLQRTVDYHENILQFRGITKLEADIIQKYMLVLEYADSGTLNDYLKEHFNELDWIHKFELAQQLASAIACIHSEDIIHRDLHADNVLIHKKGIKLADFGLSRKIAEVSSNAKIFGVIPYVDPKSFNNNENQSQNYKLNKKSDVYSFGVLMWQISSGYKPFCTENDDYDVSLALDIVNGKREQIVDSTPIEYSNLYKECWENEPNKRPNIQEVVSTLKTIISRERGDVSIVSSNEEQNHLLIENIPPNKETENSNSDLILDDITDISKYKITKSEGSSSSQIQASVQLNTTFQKANLSKDSFESTVDTINNIIIEKLIEVIIKEHNEKGIVFDQIQRFINQQILRLNQTSDNLIKWLLKNQVKSQYTFLLGLFYYYNIDIEENGIRVFELFAKEADDNCSIAQVYLAKCYNDGYGTECNKNLAFHWYQKSVENESIIGHFYLGYCYELGIGVQKNIKESVYWYQKAANKGNIPAKFYHADCYRLGRGIEKNNTKAFEYYEILSNQEFADVQYQLGNCFYHGIGTNESKAQAKYWYEKATKNGNIIAKDILKKHYNKSVKVEISKTRLQKISDFRRLSQFGLNYLGTKLRKNNYKKGFNNIQMVADKMIPFNNFYKKEKGVRKDGRKAFEFHKTLAEQGHINAKFQLGYCYDEGIGTDINKPKAFELYKVAAEGGNNEAQFNLSLLYEFGEGVYKDERKAYEIIKKLAEKGDFYAKYNLAYCYFKGIGTKMNKRKAFDLNKIAAKKGNIEARYNLSLLYQLGEGIDKDERKAFDLIKILAEKEYLDAQFQLAYYYSNGIGTEINKSKAFELYKVAAEKGHNKAQFNLSLLYQLGEGVDKDEKKAFELIQKLSEKAYLKAQFQLGYYYDEGIGTEVDKSKAFELYKVAADKGNNKAQFNLSLLYQLGEGVDKNEKKAFKLIQKLSEREYLAAQFRLGNYYSNGIGTDVNKSRAFELYKVAAEKGHNDASFNLSLLYQLGGGVDKNEEKAFELIQKLAENGYLRAQFTLGYYYSNGIGTEVNKSKAFDLYKLAAEKGDNKAQFNLGLLYQFGEGVDKNEKKAFELIQKLAENDYLKAQFLLGYYYDKGIGTEINKSRAFELYSVAAEKGNHAAQNNLGNLYEVKKDFKAAFYWYNKAAENGGGLAQYNLGKCYELGNGINKNLDKAFKFYNKSAESGYIGAKLQLGYCYINGIGTEVNRAKGLELYDKAARKIEQINIALQYENDEEIDDDLDKVIYWFHQAAANNNQLALYKLGEFYELGQGIDKNEIRAVYFYEKSANQDL